jgi:UDP-N-acetylglucosamine 2-epimerase
MTKVLCVFGTRPEAIKLAPVIQELGKHVANDVRCKVCVTAQHRGLLDEVLRIFAIQPDYDLNIMQEDQDLSYVTAKALKGVEEVIRQERPDWVVVQGDTTTTMAAAMAAFYQGVRVAHVEAGLRTYDRRKPFPAHLVGTREPRQGGHSGRRHRHHREHGDRCLTRRGFPRTRVRGCTSPGHALERKAGPAGHSAPARELWPAI